VSEEKKPNDLAIERLAEVKQRSNEQTLIRRRLLANGYTPLANKGKVPIPSGWQKLRIDEEKIAEWDRMAIHPTTGVRLESGLAVADFDIDDRAAMDAIINSMPEELRVALKDAPVRHSGGAKEAWFFRYLGAPFTRRSSSKFVAPEADPEKASGHQLEVFDGAPSKAGGSSRQFGAFRAHTFNSNTNEVKKEYGWRETSLLDVPLVKLPVLTKEQVDALCRHVDHMLIRLGWTSLEKKPLSEVKGKTAFKQTKVYDLTEDMVFDIAIGEPADGGPGEQVTLQQLMDLAKGCGPEKGVRLRATFVLLKDGERRGACSDTCRCKAF
jgi:hypothetical protein